MTQNENGRISLFLCILSLLVASVGISVIAGWHFEQPWIVQIHPNFVPMQYNTALGFALIGAALLATFKGWGTCAKTAAGVAALIGTLTLIEYATGVSLGIDELLMEHNITVQSSHPGRMAPNTALCFLLMGAAILWTSWNPGVSAIVASCVCSLALVASIGYIVDIPTAYGWGRLTRMALHTGLTFMLASTTLMAWCWSRSSTKFPSWSPALATITAATISLVGWQSIVAQNDTSNRSRAHGYKIIMEHQLKDLSDALERMARRMDRKDLANESDRNIWISDAQSYREYNSVIEVIAIFDSKGNNTLASPLNATITWDNPLLFQRHDPAERSTMATTVRSDGTFLIANSVLQNDQPRALLVAKCGFPELLAATPTLSEAFRVSVRDPQQSIVSPFNHTIDFADTSVPVTLEPVDRGPNGNVAANAMLTIGLISSLLLYWLFQSLLRNESNLDTLRVYSDTLARSNQELLQFANVAAHDLRAPLRGLKNLATWVREDLEDEEVTISDSVRGHLNALKTQVSRMEGLLSGLLQYSRVSTDQHTISEVDLHELLTDAIAMADVPDTFTVNLADQWPTLLTAPNVLTRVFQNLIDNAVKHHHSDDGTIDIAFTEKDDEIIFRVSDDGPGVPQESRDRVFKIFQTMKPTEGTQNSGIGLAVVHKLIAEQGGAVTIKDNAKGGATFRIIWPKQSTQTIRKQPR